MAWLPLLLRGEVSPNDMALQHYLSRMPTPAAACHVFTLLQTHASSLCAQAIDFAVCAFAHLARRSDGAEQVHAITAVVEHLSRLDGDVLPGNAEAQRAVLLETLRRMNRHPRLTHLVAEAVHVAHHTEHDWTRLVPAIFCRAGETIDDLVQRLDALLSRFEEDLNTCHDVERRCRAITALSRLYDRGRDLFAATPPPDLQPLAAELANCVVNSVRLDPSAKVRLAALRFCLSLAPQLEGKEVLGVLLLKVRDRQASVRAAALVGVERLHDEHERDRPPGEPPLLSRVPVADLHTLVCFGGEHAVVAKAFKSVVEWLPEGGAPLLLHQLRAAKQLHVYSPLLQRHGALLLARTIGEV
ncbi:hypothetical protein AB1Y20_010491 [Prymnesium parvum]|uniref:Uncharacterized protein n=1 Tax=Prymnesium parvum TaxID=97485 RepID=A0AB34INU1_PRYPA